MAPRLIMKGMWIMIMVSEFPISDDVAGVENGDCIYFGNNVGLWEQGWSKSKCDITRPFICAVPSELNRNIRIHGKECMVRMNGNGMSLMF